jgi:hypothetical protein
MFRSTALAAVLVFAPVFVSAQEEAVPIGDISVAVELDAVDANALDRWPEIGPDLEAAIRQAAAPYLADNGRTVSVVLNEVSLGVRPFWAKAANSTVSADGSMCATTSRNRRS